MVISPKGNLAVTIEASGSNRPKDTLYYHPGGTVGVLRIDGKNVTRVGAVTVGALPEGAASSADGNYLYVGNFIDTDLSVLRVVGNQITDAGDRFKLPGQPASHLWEPDIPMPLSYIHVGRNQSMPHGSSSHGMGYGWH